MRLTVSNRIEVFESELVDESVWFTFDDLCRVCCVEDATLLALIDEEVLGDIGLAPDQDLFSGLALQRVKRALRLARDLELNWAGVALVMDLLDEIQTLRSRLGETAPED